MFLRTFIRMLLTDRFENILNSILENVLKHVFKNVLKNVLENVSVTLLLLNFMTLLGTFLIFI